MRLHCSNESGEAFVACMRNIVGPIPPQPAQDVSPVPAGNPSLLQGSSGLNVADKQAPKPMPASNTPSEQPEPPADSEALEHVSTREEAMCHAEMAIALTTLFDAHELHEKHNALYVSVQTPRTVDESAGADADVPVRPLGLFIVDMQARHARTCQNIVAQLTLRERSRDGEEASPSDAQREAAAAAMARDCPPALVVQTEQQAQQRDTAARRLTTENIAPGTARVSAAVARSDAR